MSDTPHFTDAQWSLIKAAPHWVFEALSAADGRASAIVKRKEAVAMSKIIEEADNDNVLVQAAVDAAEDDHGLPKKIEVKDALAKLKAVNALLDDKVGREAGEEFRDFLMDIGNAVAAAAKEGILAKEAVSDEEKEALQDIAVALQATASYKQRRLNLEKKEEREAKAAAAKAAAAKAAAAARVKKEAAARKAANSAHAKRIAEARAKRAAAAKKAAEDKAKADAAAAQAAAERKAAEAARRKAAAAEADRKRAQRVASAKKAQAEKAAAAAAAAEAAKWIGEHTVGAGDSLSAIAARYYGSGVRSNWMAIYEANKDVIGRNPSLIIPGQVLRIPKLG